MSDITPCPQTFVSIGAMEAYCQTVGKEGVDSRYNAAIELIHASYVLPAGRDYAWKAIHNLVTHANNPVKLVRNILNHKDRTDGPAFFERQEIAPELLDLTLGALKQSVIRNNYSETVEPSLDLVKEQFDRFSAEKKASTLSLIDNVYQDLCTYTMLGRPRQYAFLKANMPYYFPEIEKPVGTPKRPATMHDQAAVPETAQPK